MGKFLQLTIVDNDNLKITVLSILWVLAILSIALILNLLFRRQIARIKVREGSVSSFARRVFMIINLSIWIVAAVIIIISLDLSLETKLIDNENFILKPIHFIFAAVIIVGTRILLMGIEKLFGMDSLITPGDSSRKKNVLKFFTYVIWVLALLLILNQTGLKLTFLLGAGAALLVGIGFGLQQIFADLISGLFLLFEGNLHEDDVVELNNGTIGLVTFIGIRTSKVKTRDNVVMIIPNSYFISQQVINWSHMEAQTRFNVGVGVAYGSDVQLVKKVLLGCAQENTDISLSPEPFVRFQDFGESSLDFSLYFWTANTFEVENLKSDIRFSIEQSFREHDIQIPFPQRDVHVISGTRDSGRGLRD